MPRLTSLSPVSLRCHPCPVSPVSPLCLSGVIHAPSRQSLPCVSKVSSMPRLASLSPVSLRCHPCPVSPVSPLCLSGVIHAPSRQSLPRVSQVSPMPRLTSLSPVSLRCHPCPVSPVSPLSPVSHVSESRPFFPYPQSPFLFHPACFFISLSISSVFHRVLSRVASTHSFPLSHLFHCPRLPVFSVSTSLPSLPLSPSSRVFRLYVSPISSVSRFKYSKDFIVHLKHHIKNGNCSSVTQ